MIIKISGLRDGIYDFDFDNDISELGLEAPFFGNFITKISLNKSHNQIILTANLSIKANFDCDRCSSNYERVLNSKFQLVYFFGKEPVDSDSINTAYLPLEADKINLRAELRDFAVLSIPMKNLCKEDCLGLCYKCGKNLNEGECDCGKTTGNRWIDSKWQPLIELKKRLNNN
jgi:uncharacterized protein